MTDPALAVGPARALAGLVAALHQVVSRDRSGADAAGILREVGLEAGESISGLFRQWLDRSGTPGDPAELAPEEFWGALSSFFEDLGWGTIEIEQPHPGVLSISSADWFEADRVPGRHPGCHVTTALLADLLRRVVEEELACLEVECRAAGHDRCRFLVGSPAALERIFQSLREGSEYPSAVGALD
jgi:predicted hydrocarbon binding protein